MALIYTNSIAELQTIKVVESSPLGGLGLGPGGGAGVGVQGDLGGRWFRVQFKYPPAIGPNTRLKEMYLSFRHTGIKRNLGRARIFADPSI